MQIPICPLLQARHVNSCLKSRVTHGQVVTHAETLSEIHLLWSVACSLSSRLDLPPPLSKQKPFLLLLEKAEKSLFAQQVGLGF